MSRIRAGKAVEQAARESRIVRPSETWRVWIEEVSVGWINGPALGIIIAALAWLTHE